jgi:hypothetical protein
MPPFRSNTAFFTSSTEARPCSRAAASTSSAPSMSAPTRGDSTAKVTENVTDQHPEEKGPNDVLEAPPFALKDQVFAYGDPVNSRSRVFDLLSERRGGHESLALFAGNDADLAEGLEYGAFDPRKVANAVLPRDGHYIIVLKACSAQRLTSPGAIFDNEDKRGRNGTGRW